jgi:hypothetical protein
MILELPGESAMRLGGALMNPKQELVVMRMLGDPRIPLDIDVFAESILASPPGVALIIPEENLNILARYVPDLVAEFYKLAT